MAFQFARPDTAFSVAPMKGKRRPRQEKSDHLAFIRELPCVICGEMPVHAAHVRYGDMTYGKRETGMGEKPDDRWTVPLAPRFHKEGPDSQHAGGERAFWIFHDIDPLRIALALWGVSGDHDAARVILVNVRSKAR